MADLYHDDRDALLVMLGVPVLLYPIIFIRGECLDDGGPAIIKLDKEHRLVERVLVPRVPFVPKAVEAKPEPRPLLLHQAGGGNWRGCQTTIYGNVLRGIAALQVALLVPAQVLTSNGQVAASVPFLALLALDSLLFVLLGPTPWTPLGCLSTLIVWHRRGTVAPLVPYKVTFGGLYLVFNVVGLVCRLADDDSGVCGLVQSDGLVLTMITNSALLAVFRF